MDDVFTYNWTSLSAKEYLYWLESMQTRCNHRRCMVAVIAACVFAAGGILCCIVAMTSIPNVYMLAFLGTTLLAAILMTDNCRGYPYFEPVGYIIQKFSQMNEFDIGQYEKKALFCSLGVEFQKLLYCLRITSNLHKYKKIDVILSRWKIAMEHGSPFFKTSPRGKLTFDFLTQIYFFNVKRVLSEYALAQYNSILKLKTDTAKQHRLEKIKENFEEILAQNGEFPQIQELLNGTYKTIWESVHA